MGQCAETHTPQHQLGLGTLRDLRPQMGGFSEGDYGVSLLNDCKYGHDIHDNVMRITLLRSPTMPDPMADFGEHEFKYSLYPHAGSWNEETQREAYLLNDPIIVLQSQSEP